MKNILIFVSLIILVSCFTPETLAQKERDLKPANSANNQKATSPSKAQNTKVSKTDSKSSKKVVAVLSFEDASLGNKELALGRHLVDSLTKELARTKEYSVAEKMQIEAVMKEMNLSFDEAMDPKTAARVGKRVSANTAVFGTITEYNVVDKETKVLGVSRTRYTATVGLIIRLVDINTGLILESAESNESASDEALKVGEIYGSNTKDSRDFRIKLFTKAADKAVKTAVKQLSPFIQNSGATQTVAQTKPVETTKAFTPTKNSTSEPTRAVSNTSNSSPKISRIVKEIVYLSGMNNAKVGDLLSVVRGSGAGKEVALLEVTEVNENFVKAKIVEGSGILQNDRVQIVQ